MADKKDAQVMLAALREEIPIPYSQEKYVLRGIMKGLERLEKKKPPLERQLQRGKNNIYLYVYYSTNGGF